MRALKQLKLRHYPQFADYDALSLEFRPFTMFTHTANYSSPSVSTDAFGLRQQTFANGETFQLEKIPSTKVNILLGNSTAFGIGASSNQTTTAALLSHAQLPCLNLGVRAATTQQELFLFINLHCHFPKIQRLFILTGICNCTLAALPRALYYPQWGGIFSEKHHFKQFLNQYELSNDTRVHTVQRRLCKMVEKLMSWRSKSPALSLEKHRALFAENMRFAEAVIRSTLTTWGMMARYIPITILLQPIIGWTRKPLTALEKEIFETEISETPSNRFYLEADFYQNYRTIFQQSCHGNGIEFHDTNDWMNEDASLTDKEIFCDLCHLTDKGQSWLASQLQQRYPQDFLI